MRWAHHVLAQPQRRDDGTGRVYLTQWFERGRLEYHAELAGTRYEVQLGLGASRTSAAAAGYNTDGAFRLAVITGSTTLATGR